MYVLHSLGLDGVCGWDLGWLASPKCEWCAQIQCTCIFEAYGKCKETKCTCCDNTDLSSSCKKIFGTDGRTAKSAPSSGTPGRRRRGPPATVDFEGSASTSSRAGGRATIAGRAGGQPVSAAAAASPRSRASTAPMRSNRGFNSSSKGSPTTVTKAPKRMQTDFGSRALPPLPSPARLPPLPSHSQADEDFEGFADALSGESGVVDEDNETFGGFEEACDSVKFTKKECSEPRLSGSAFCTKHTCDQPGCFKLKSSRVEYCNRHKNQDA